MKTLADYVRRERAVPLDIKRLRTMQGRAGLKFVEWGSRSSGSADSVIGSSGSGKGAILLLSSANREVGHYVLLLRSGAGGIEYFDPYGLAPGRLAAILGWKPNAVSAWQSMLKGTKRHHKRLQSTREEINVCGRYCVCRFNFGWASYDQFLGILHHGSLSPDDVVTLLTLSADLSHWKQVQKDER